VTLLERLLQRQRREAAVDIDRYKMKLLDLERELSQRIEKRVADASALTDQAEATVQDDEIADEVKDDEFAVVDRDTHLLREVRDALRRIDEGTYGQCAVDGGPIEEKRLNAAPWTRYCLKHQEELEARNNLRTPTL
jgi:RNA polymerase-binding transcription factor DksA